MAVKLHLMRMGKKKQPTYRLVAADSRSPRDGRFIEIVGWYAPRSEEAQKLTVDAQRAQHWLSVGAQPTEVVVSILKRSGDWQKFTGDDSPAGIDPQPEPTDKLARFNAALAEADGEPAAEAISRKSKKAEAEEAAEATEEA